MKAMLLITAIVCASLWTETLFVACEDSLSEIPEKLDDSPIDGVDETPPEIPLARSRFHHRGPVRAPSGQHSPIRIPSVVKSPVRAPAKLNAPIQIPNHKVVKQPPRIPTIVKTPPRIPNALKPPMRIPNIRVPTAVKQPARIPTVVKPHYRVPDVVKPPLRVPFASKHEHVPAKVNLDDQISSGRSRAEGEMLLKHQEWAEARDRPHADDSNDVVHDASVGDTGITALRDEDMNACFINHYQNPFVIPTTQRSFYTHTKPATVAESDVEIEEFTNYVGPIVAEHCRHLECYWLDLDLFHMFIYGEDQSELKTEPPTKGSARGSDGQDGEVGPAP